MQGQVATVKLQYRSTLSAEHFKLKVKRLEVDEGALLTCSGGDRDQDTVLASRGDGSSGAGGAKKQAF